MSIVTPVSLFERNLARNLDHRAPTGKFGTTNAFFALHALQTAKTQTTLLFGIVTMHYWFDLHINEDGASSETYF